MKLVKIFMPQNLVGLTSVEAAVPQAASNHRIMRGFLANR